MRMRLTGLVLLVAVATLSASTFTLHGTETSGRALDSQTVDLNRDGIPDLAVLTGDTAGHKTLRFFSPDVTGTLQSKGSLNAPFAAGFGVGDLNGDGIPDLAVAQTSKSSTDGLCAGTAPSVLLYRGTAAVGAKPTYVFLGCVPGSGTTPMDDVAIADVTGDGKADLLVGFYGGAAGFAVYPGNGNGTVGARVNVPGTTGLRVTGPMFVADVNGDGLMDVVTHDFGGVGTFLGQGAGAFTFVPTAVGSSQLWFHYGVTSFVLADVNGDGLPDIVGVERGTLPATPTTTGNFLFVSLGTGNGTTYVNTDTHGFPLSDAMNKTVGGVSVGDLDDNGLPDVLTTEQDGTQATVWMNQGGGVLASSAVFPIGVHPTFTAITDVSRDGHRDLVVTESSLLDPPSVWTAVQGGF